MTMTVDREAYDTMGAKPLILTPVPAEDIERGDGRLVAEFIEGSPETPGFCRITKESVGGRYGDLIRLRPWQRDLTDMVYARTANGRLRHREALIGLPRKNGKDLDIDTLILTAEGWKTMGALREGDFVHAPDGSLTRVLWVGERQPKETFAVRFKDGSEIVAGASHEWLVNDCMHESPMVNGFRDRQHPPRVRTTEQLRQSLRFGRRDDCRYTVTVPAPLDRPEVPLPIAPYVLGAWLGDGASASGKICGVDPEIFDQIEKNGYQVLAPQHDANLKRAASGFATRTVAGLTARLRALGVLGRKHIPERYLLASFDQRLELLRGLMDTDGTVGFSGPRRVPQCSFTNTNKAIAEGVLFLVRSLGWKAAIRPGRARLNGRDCGPKYTICWHASRLCSPFHLWRKSGRLSETTGKRSKVNSIVSIEPAGLRQTCCIAVDHPSHCYLAGRTLTPTHNSALGSSYALNGLVMGPQGGEVYSCAADREQARIVFGAAKKMVQLDPQLDYEQGGIIKTYRDALEYVETGSIYKVLSSEAFTKEGLNPTVVVYDELHAAETDELYYVMTQAMGARYDPLFIIITTAGTKTDITGQDSICYRRFQYGQKVASGEIVDPTFFMAWYGAPQGADHKDPEVWKAANPGYGDLIDPQDFVSVLGKVSENEFRALDVNTPILTMTGWKTMGSVEVGDWVFGGDGSPAEVIGTSSLFTGRRCYSVKLDGAAEIVADDQHEWIVTESGSSSGHRKLKVTTGELVPDRSRRRYIELPGPLQLPEADLLVDPYVLGVWLGDGSSGEPLLTMHADDVPHMIAQVEAAGYYWTHRVTPSAHRLYVSSCLMRRGGRSSRTREIVDEVGLLRSQGLSLKGISEKLGIPYGSIQRIASGATKAKVGTLRSLLIDLGVLNNKHIPECYLLASPAQRLALLQGLLDTDGSVASGRVTFCNTNRNLVDGVLFLARSLGWLARVRELKTGYAPAWQVSWTLPRPSQPFRMERKQRLVSFSENHDRCSRSRVMSVSEVPSRPTRCIAVDHPDHTFLVGRSLTVTANTKRLDMWVSSVQAWLPAGTWNKCRNPDRDFVPGKRGIVLGFDGSRNGDSTALVGVTVDSNPVIKVFGLWEKPVDAGPDWKVPRGAVKDTIRKTCRENRVREIAWDEWLWDDAAEELEEEGLPIVRFPQTMTMMGPATQRFYEMVTNQRLEHGGDARLARHLENAQLKTDTRGARLVKDHKSSPRKIDLAVASVMAVHRAAYYLNQPVEDEPMYVWKDEAGVEHSKPVSQVGFVW